MHTDAGSADPTDWRQIVALYDQLIAVDPTPVVALNRAIAVAEVDGPEKGLTILEGLHLKTYHAYQAARADLLRRAGQHTAAGAAHRRAIELTSNPAEKGFLRGRLDEMTARTDHEQ